MGSQELGGETVDARSSVRRNALGQKLSCCWQDREASVSDPGLVAGDGCVRRWQDCSSGAAASTRDYGSAICGSCPDRPAGILGPRRSSGGDSRRAASAGSAIRYRPTDQAETSTVGRPAHNSDIAVGPYRRCRTDGSGEEFRNCYRVRTVPADGFPPTTKPMEMRLFYSGAGTRCR
jgi:hypothetical protein